MTPFLLWFPICRLSHLQIPDGVSEVKLENKPLDTWQLTRAKSGVYFFSRQGLPSWLFLSYLPLLSLYERPRNSEYVWCRKPPRTAITGERCQAPEYRVRASLPAGREVENSQLQIEERPSNSRGQERNLSTSSSDQLVVNWFSLALKHKVECFSEPSTHHVKCVEISVWAVMCVQFSIWYADSPKIPRSA